MCELSLPDGIKYSQTLVIMDFPYETHEFYYVKHNVLGFKCDQCKGKKTMFLPEGKRNLVCFDQFELFYRLTRTRGRRFQPCSSAKTLFNQFLRNLIHDSSFLSSLIFYTNDHQFVNTNCTKLYNKDLDKPFFIVDKMRLWLKDNNPEYQRDILRSIHALVRKDVSVDNVRRAYRIISFIKQARTARFWRQEFGCTWDCSTVGDLRYQLTSIFRNFYTTAK